MNTLRDATRAGMVHLRAHIGRGISAQGFYAQHLRFRDLVFDIGANTGKHTAAMLKRGARVVAVEPQAGLADVLRRDFPAATVLRVGVSDRPGQATLMTSPNDDVATLNPRLPDSVRNTISSTVVWDGEEQITLTTLDALIEEFGCPAFIKVDTEGFDDKVLAGLTQPVDQLLFEVLSGLPDVARGCCDRLAELGRYQYRLMVHDVPGRETWQFGAPVTATELLGALPSVGDVYARRVE